MADSVESAIDAGCRLDDEVFVIGGATLYEASLAIADNLYITQINQDFDGDTFFPDFDGKDWLELEREDVTNDERVGFTYSFLKYKAINKQE